MLLKNIKNKYFAFSLIELMITLITISCIIAAFTPVISKRLKSSNVTIKGNNVSDITTECTDKFSNSCKLCTKSYCIQCDLSNCTTGTYAESKSCTCKDCSTLYSNCIECDSNKCTKCKDNNYYINNGKCEICPSNKICDGINAYDESYCINPPDGYYCDGNNIKKCSDKYDSFCVSCNSSTCTACASGRYLSDQKCLPCNINGCAVCNAYKCLSCFSGFYLNSATNECISCKTNLSNCSQCTSANNCSLCDVGYYKNSQNKCSSCLTIPNCISCSNDGKCKKCSNGYYVNSNYSCKKCEVANCAQCDSSGNCLSCIQGYHLSQDNIHCEANNANFNCSDSNFVQIGKLCITRRNMGDSAILKIPSSVYTVNANSEFCQAGSSKCCWRGKTGGNCIENETSGYSGCNRTVCNWYAAKEICSKFSYGGKTWRLPNYSEMQDWWIYTLDLSSQGLLLCDSDGDFYTAHCGIAYGCFGSYDSICYPPYVWAQENSGKYYSYLSSSGNWLGPWNYPHSEAFSVRCVTEME